MLTADRKKKMFIEHPPTNQNNYRRGATLAC